jgi:hypothetical protein
MFAIACAHATRPAGLTSLRDRLALSNPFCSQTCSVCVLASLGTNPVARLQAAHRRLDILRMRRRTGTGKSRDGIVKLRSLRTTAPHERRILIGPSLVFDAPADVVGRHRASALPVPKNDRRPWRLLQQPQSCGDSVQMRPLTSNPAVVSGNNIHHGLTTIPVSGRCQPNRGAMLVTSADSSFGSRVCKLSTKD